MISRRNFCAGLVLAIAAPYVVRNSGVLMPVRDRTRRIVYAIRATTESANLMLPIGVIYPFVNHPPKGWVPFDGRTITRESYPELFKAANWWDFGDMKLEMVEPHIPSLRGRSSIRPLRAGVPL